MQNNVSTFFSLLLICAFATACSSTTEERSSPILNEDNYQIEFAVALSLLREDIKLNQQMPRCFFEISNRTFDALVGSGEKNTIGLAPASAARRGPKGKVFHAKTNEAGVFAYVRGIRVEGDLASADAGLETGNVGAVAFKVTLTRVLGKWTVVKKQVWFTS